MYRPGYPEALFEWLAGVAPDRGLAWDCACGNGQATLGLAKRFKRVVGTDASEAQIAAAPRKAGNVDWRVAAAEASGLGEGVVDLVTVAQALHWFHLNNFYAEARRVLRPAGVLAVWSYGLNTVKGAEINERVQDFYENVVGPYWPPERKIVESGYRILEFPFAELKVPAFAMDTHWTLPQLLGYFRTWSATSRYIAERGHDPVERLGGELAETWGDPAQARLVSWPLSLRVGRKI